MVGKAEVFPHLRGHVQIQSESTFYVLVVCEIDSIFVANLEPNEMRVPLEHIIVNRIAMVLFI